MCSNINLSFTINQIDLLHFKIYLTIGKQASLAYTEAPPILFSEKIAVSSHVELRPTNETESALTLGHN